MTDQTETPTVKIDKAAIKNFLAPKVLVYARRDGTKTMDVVYSNRIETYELQTTHTKAELEAERKTNNAVGIDGNAEWSQWQEIEILTQNGYRFIHYHTPEGGE